MCPIKKSSEYIMIVIICCFLEKFCFLESMIRNNNKNNTLSCSISSSSGIRVASLALDRAGDVGRPENDIITFPLS